LSDSVTYKQLLRSRGALAQQLLDMFQDSRPKLSKALARLSKECELYPTCYSLLELKKVGSQVAGGGFVDIWKGLVGGQPVAVKCMRGFLDVDVKASLKRFGREAVIWRQLSHPNLLPFFGLYTCMFSPTIMPCLISPRMDNGDLHQFLSRASSDIDRRSL
ncbi:hypothetical protein DFH06DRAFT_949289, partial [Mycena polygramma]